MSLYSVVSSSREAEFFSFWTCSSCISKVIPGPRFISSQWTLEIWIFDRDRREWCIKSHTTEKRAQAICFLNCALFLLTLNVWRCSRYYSCFELWLSEQFGRLCSQNRPDRSCRCQGNCNYLVHHWQYVLFRSQIPFPPQVSSIHTNYS